MFGIPVTVIAPDPPKIRVPVLMKLVPASLMVWDVAGAKLNVPVVLTVPLFVNDPLKLCVPEFPLKLDPALTLNAVLTVHEVPELIPPLPYTFLKSQSSKNQFEFKANPLLLERMISRSINF